MKGLIMLTLFTSICALVTFLMFSRIIDNVRKDQLRMSEVISDIQSAQHDQLEREINIFKSFHNSKINRGKNEN